MPSHDTPEELRLTVERGGSLTCTPARDNEQRATQCNMAWGLSMMFGGERVRVQDYLPGLHLDVQALRLPEPLPPGPVPHPHPVHRTMLDWDRVDRTLWNALHGRWASEEIVVKDEEVRCVIRQATVTHDASMPIAFTLQCRWPGVLGRDAVGATRTTK